MNILVCGDKHLKMNRFDLAKQFLAWLDQTIEVTRPDLYVCLGDDMDTHSILHSPLLSELRYHFDYVLSLGIPIVYIVGNHDMFKPNDIKYHAFQGMKNFHKDFYVVDEVCDLFDMTFVPYIHDPSQFPFDTKSICFAHQTFKGADFGDITTQDGVESEKVSADIIISGHIHKKQVLGKVVYPGSPFSQSVSDVNQIKGVMMFDTATLRTKDIPCPLPMWKSFSVEILQGTSLEEICKDIENTLNNKDHWIIEISGPKAEINSILDSNIYKGIIKGKQVRPIPSYTDKERKKVKIKSFTVEDIVSEYINKVYSGAIDKKILAEEALKVIIKAKK